MGGRYPRATAHTEERLVLKDLDTGAMVSVVREIDSIEVIRTDNTPPTYDQRIAGHYRIIPIREGKGITASQMPTRVTPGKATNPKRQTGRKWAPGFRSAFR